jgi:hypothetical protein
VEELLPLISWLDIQKVAGDFHRNDARPGNVLLHWHDDQNGVAVEIEKNY